MSVRLFVKIVALAVVYYLAARLGLRYASIGHSISLVWPPTGIALAALVVLGFGAWPGVAIGAFLANAATPVPLATAGFIAVGNTLEAILAAAILIRAAGPRPRMDAMVAVRALVTSSAPLGALVSALIGVTALALSGALPSSAAASAVAVWWTGDLLGALVIAPLLLAWALGPPSTASATPVGGQTSEMLCPIEA